MYVLFRPFSFIVCVGIELWDDGKCPCSSTVRVLKGLERELERERELVNLRSTGACQSRVDK